MCAMCNADYPVQGKKTTVTYKQWSDLLQKSFEKSYYVPADPTQDSKYDVNPAMVNRRGIYKDVYGTPKDREWSDYQLRCNFPLAMIVAPELFNPEHAMGALKIAEASIKGPLGMKTLDPMDSQYRGNYDNSNDSSDRSVAKGWNVSATFCRLQVKADGSTTKVLSGVSRSVGS